MTLIFMAIVQNSCDLFAISVENSNFALKYSQRAARLMANG